MTGVWPVIDYTGFSIVRPWAEPVWEVIQRRQRYVRRYIQPYRGVGALPFGYRWVRRDGASTEGETP